MASRERDPSPVALPHLSPLSETGVFKSPLSRSEDRGAHDGGQTEPTGPRGSTCRSAFGSFGSSFFIDSLPPSLIVLSLWAADTRRVKRLKMNQNRLV